MPDIDAQKRLIADRVPERRRGRLLTTLLWPVLVLMSAVTIAATLPLRFQQLSSIRPDAVLTSGQLDPQSAAALAEAGMRLICRRLRER